MAITVPGVRKRTDDKIERHVGGEDERDGLSPVWIKEVG